MNTTIESITAQIRNILALNATALGLIKANCLNIQFCERISTGNRYQDIYFEIALKQERSDPREEPRTAQNAIEDLIRELDNILPHFLGRRETQLILGSRYLKVSDLNVWSVNLKARKE